MRSVKFWIFVAAVACSWVVMRWQPWLERDVIYAAILVATGITCMAASAAMIIVRIDWTARALGICGVFGGIGWLFAGWGATRFEWRGRIGEAELDAIAMTVFWGGTLFGLGFVRWVIAYRRGDADADVTNGRTIRRREDDAQ